MARDPLVTAAHAAIEGRDWEAVRSLLHPYVHWHDGAGPPLRGRTTVLSMLARTAPPAPPSSWDVRGGQICRGRS